MSFDASMDSKQFSMSAGDAQTSVSELVLFQSMDNGQILLAELGNVYALQAYFKDHHIKFTIDYRVNAEDMSPDGVLPLVKYGEQILSGYGKIIDFVNKVYEIKTAPINSDIVAKTNLFEKAVIKTELYYTWLDKDIYEKFTKSHYSYGKPWLLANILCWMKKRDVASKISDQKSIYDNEFDLFFTEISNDFGYNNSKLTEQDALIYGHVKALKTYSENYVELFKIIEKFQTLFQFVDQVDSKHNSRL